MPRRRHLILWSVFWLSASALTANAAPFDDYVQTDLVSDMSGLAAVTDPNLKNPWGVSESSSSPLWISDQAAHAATLYTINGLTATQAGGSPPLVVAIAAPGPTGTVNNSGSSFVTTQSGGTSAPAHFIFANLNGGIYAWAKAGNPAMLEVMTAGASYTGLAINQAQTQLYAANNVVGGGIDVYNGSFGFVETIATPMAISSLGLVPFDVRDIGGVVYVTYALPGHVPETMAAGGEGAVATFSESGTPLSLSFTSPELASPWGIALAPANFGEFSNDLLVANFAYGNLSSAGGEINVYNPTTGAFIDTLDSDPSFQGLWALTFGNNGINGGSPDVLYFTTGLNGEKDGLLAAISVPEPSALVQFGTALGLLGLFGVRRSRKKSARGFPEQCRGT